MHAARIPILVARLWELTNATARPTRAADARHVVKLDDVAFLRNDPNVREWDTDLVRAVGAILVPGSMLPVADRLRFVGLDTAVDVKRAWQRNRDVVRVQFMQRLGGQGRKPMGRGIALFHLAQVLAVRSGGGDALGRLLAIREAPVHIGDPSDITRIERAIADAITEVEGTNRL